MILEAKRTSVQRRSKNNRELVEIRDGNSVIIAAVDVDPVDPKKKSWNKIAKSKLLYATFTKNFDNKVYRIREIFQGVSFKTVSAEENII